MGGHSKTAGLIGTPDEVDCLVEKFWRYLELTGAEAMFLSLLQTKILQVQQKQDVIVQGNESEYLYVLNQGWAHSYKILGNGERQVLEFLLPGDFLGIREFAFNQALNFVVMSTDGVICPFPKSRISEMFNNFPRLAATMVQIGTREQAVLVERICNVGSRSAYERVGHQILELWVRLRAVGLAESGSFRFPIRQVVLADALGLSPVHVNRTLKKLKCDGLLEIQNGTATILNLERLIEVTQFEEFYLAEEAVNPYMV